MARGSTITQQLWDGAAEDLYKADPSEVGWTLNMDNNSKHGRMFNYFDWFNLNATQVILTCVANDTLHGAGFYELAVVGGNLAFQFRALNSGVAAVLGTAPGLEVQGRMMVEYYGSVYFMANTGPGTQSSLYYFPTSGGAAISVGALTDSFGNPYTGECGDGMYFEPNGFLYFTYGNNIGAYFLDVIGAGVYTKFYGPVLVINSIYNIASISTWNDSITFSMNPVIGGNFSKVGFWDGYSANIDFSKRISHGNIDCLKLVDGYLYCITSYNSGGVGTGFSASTNNLLCAYVYYGNEFVLEAKKVGIRTTGASTPVYIGQGNRNYACVSEGSTLYFCAPILFRGYIDPTGYNINQVVIWKFQRSGTSIYNNKWQLTPDRELPVTTMRPNCMSMYNDILLVNDPGNLYWQENITTPGVGYMTGKVLTKRFDCDFKWRKKKLIAVQLNSIPSSPLENPVAIVSTDSITLTVITGNNASYTVPVNLVQYDYGMEWQADLEQTAAQSQEWETIQFYIQVNGSMQLSELSFVYDIKPQKVYDRRNE